MRIAVVGTGHMGGTIGRRWAEAGHQIMFGSRNPQSEKVKSLLQRIGKNAQVGTIKEAISFGEVILLAVLSEGVEQTLIQAGDLDNKVLINCTIFFDGQSADEIVQKLAKNARVVRAFHTLTWEVVANPKFGSTNASVFLNSADAGAKKVVAQLIRDIDLDPIDVGTVENMKQIDGAIQNLWMVLSQQYGREFGIRVLRQ
ncbi:hypothetical protein SAMN05444392_102506 [Seinonella peptonophila]|uniref:Pyrroline-5-carboxylate reductase catalytic N-terminal domain-containing protein n=1 Tax=Seinonella peptonophila TaxID=112248 RepID=A0A1M4VS82_9BACL|nr:NADPH-dependent F420 reductase [Seinonella peptonophila]SHE71725.1 hypothetical protein SAMN05444392_102506 [Seinonella peptonophila]